MLEQRKPDAGDRLDSWKAIAAYLGREPRTVQRWERADGLPVHRLYHSKAGSVYALRSELDAWRERHSREPFAQPVGARNRRRWGFRAGVVVATGVLALASGWVFSREPSRAHTARAVPLTSDPGTEMEARLSPDGARVAYVWDGELTDNFDIYVRMLAGGPPFRLTRDAARDYSPAWSPDGSTIAFLRRSGAAAAALFTVPAAGGAERKIAEVTAAIWPQWARPGPHLSWSPDGRWLVTAGQPGPDGVEALLRVAPGSGAIEPLTSPPQNALGDMAPAISPDGKSVAFSRLLSWGNSALCVVPVTVGLRPAGDVRTLRTGSSWNASAAWSPDGGSLIFSTGSMDAPYLARIRMAGDGPLVPLQGPGDNAWSPSLARARDGRTRLVYTRHFEAVNLWRTALDDGGACQSLITSAHWSYEPGWSPDGKRIAFLSDRSGHSEIWVAEANGRNPQQWTYLKQPRLGGPRWSPDGTRLAFTAPGARGSSIFLLGGPGQTPRRVAGSEECGYLAWARDGRALYFSSNRASRTDIWRIPTEGGAAVRVTDRGGRVPAISSDGRYLYYLKPAPAGGRNDLWRKPFGGVEEKVLEFVDAYSLGDAGIAFQYYRPGPQPVGPYLEYFQFATGRAERLPGSGRPLRYGIALSPDGRYLLHAQADYEVSDVMLVEDFPTP